MIACAGTGYSRLPVYHEDIDRIVGIVHYKDLVGPLMDGKENDPIVGYAYQAMFVPETKDIFPLLAEMQTKRQQMAIVVDEYGGTDGLITIEDIVEEIVGEIEDETDRENPFIKQVGDGVWIVDGRFPVEEAEELGWPVRDSDDYETIAGWLMSMLDSVPQDWRRVRIRRVPFQDPGDASPPHYDHPGRAHVRFG